MSLVDSAADALQRGSDPSKVISVPNVVGMTTLRGRDESYRAGLAVDLVGATRAFRGTGIVADQNVTTGATVPRGSRITLTLEFHEEKPSPSSYTFGCTTQ
ncbi:MAG: PASTA domain-containing protein [Acidimicrobiales bacterium]